MLLLILIPAFIGIILAYILHNCKYWNGKRFTLPLIIWILYGVGLFIPICNMIVAAIMLIYLLISLAERDVKIRDDHWLFKRY